jgi:3alpha(or 20beta)-hydroxysteroid dehydrogenase
MNRLQDKVAIVTGAARGQGEATARLFAREGARVILTDRLAAEGKAVARDIGANALFVTADVTDAGAWKKLVDETLARWDRIDVLVNNAAITDYHPFLELEQKQFEKLIAINVIGPFHGIQAVLPAMLKQGRGSIINISSVNGLRGIACMGGYDATKFALRGLTKSLALEFGARGIRVNSVHPGAIHTPMLDPTGTVDGPALAKTLGIAAKRLGKPSEVAAASLFLASDEASYVNGAELAVDGGWTAGITTDDVDSQHKISG